MAQQAPRTILITGCSSGFGLSIVRHFLSTPDDSSTTWNVIATSRNPDRTPDLVKEVNDHPSGRGKWLQLDVTDSQEVIDGVLKQAAELFGGIDVVVNNAGYSVLGVLENLDEEGARGMWEVNYWGTLKICKGIIPFFRQNQGQHTKKQPSWIVNFSSVAGVNANANVGAYAASKFAIEALSDSLAPELSPFNTHLLLLEPGMFQTNFFSTTSTSTTTSAAMTLTPLPDHYKGTAIETSHKAFQQAGQKKVLKGDTEKAATRMREVLEGRLVLEGWKDSEEGKAKRLVLGSDAFERVERVLRGRLREVQGGKEVAGSTDREGF